VLVCATASFSFDGAEGNGMTELEGIISDPSQSQNGTVFTLTDLEGNTYRCFYGSKMPGTPALCRAIGSFSSDGNIFFVDKMTVSSIW